MSIMPYTQWMSMTHGGYTSVRSNELKRVDQALAAYHQSPIADKKKALLRALTEWMEAQTAKGSNWKTSVRNRNRAVDTLWSQLTGIGQKPTHLSEAELDGLLLVRDESHHIVNTLFQNKEICWKSNIAKALASENWGVQLGVPGVVLNSKTLADGSPEARGTARQQAKELFDGLVPSEIRSEVHVVLRTVMPDFFENLAVSMVPLLGVITAGGGAVFNGVSALYRQWTMEWTRYYTAGALADGAPLEAMQAMYRCLERERNADAFSASVATGEFIGKLAGMLADGGTATTAAAGLTAGLLKLLNILRIIVRDVLEKRAVNAMLRKGGIDKTIFLTCPLAGAYMVLCSPTSVLANVVFDTTFGQTGWQDQVENAIRRFHAPLKEVARQVVTEHRFHIPALDNYPGIAVVNERQLAMMRTRKLAAGQQGPKAWDPKRAAMSGPGQDAAARP